MAEELNEDVDEETLKEMVKRIDSNMDEKISFDDFYYAITLRSK